ncbi:MAG: hypothetical protein EI684_19310 [Candidatus Viridilinea halotolerans]|uniref:Uncharacterized protein n=1 Tax=Candidatus Viridilinea halotolerans TaxID=2491704 RepID=A0A426TST4_9CHLR|nr:MAG: hypothetical protein EI684_19310 [Candidatus Viridilinea halotolerans]
MTKTQKDQAHVVAQDEAETETMTADWDVVDAVDEEAQGDGDADLPLGDPQDAALDSEGDEEGAEDAEDTEDDDVPPPPPPQPQAAAGVIKPLPTGVVPLPIIPVGDRRIPVDADTLAEAAICAAVFQRLADCAMAHVVHILASDEDLPPFYMDDADRDLLAELFATDNAIATRVRLAAGTKVRDAVG